MSSTGLISRLTPNQKRILKTLETIDREISTQALYVELRVTYKTLGLATVYQGLVQSRTSTEGEFLYSIVQKHQHYFTCLRCSKSINIDACPVCQIEADLEHKQSVKVFYHTLEFFGLCTFCQTADA
jgi:Fur family transcriptional regulator, ferric uptake regulator